jgi:hypothetical protein
MEEPNPEFRRLVDWRKLKTHSLARSICESFRVLGQVIMVSILMWNNYDYVRQVLLIWHLPVLELCSLFIGRLYGSIGEIDRKFR